MIAMEFPSGSHQVRGMLHVPPGGGRAPGVLIVPGFADTAGGMHNMHVQTARALCRDGFGVLRFDYRGLGESEGDFRDFTAQTGLADAKAALDVLRGHPGIDAGRIGILGFSLGGALAVQLAADSDSIGALALWAPVAHMERVFQGFFTERHKVEMQRQGWTDWMGWPVGEAFLRTAGEIDPVAAWKAKRIPALVIHGDHDTEVPPDNAQSYKEAGAAIHWLDGGDHLFSSMALKEEAVAHTCSWFNRHLFPTINQPAP